MKSKLLLFIGVLFMLSTSEAQTFNGGGGAIPDSGFAQACFSIPVNGIGNLSSANGLSIVCINITHQWVSDLEIYLRSPAGDTIPLSIQNGGSGDNYNSTCFSASAITPVSDGFAPFTGNYIPDGYMGIANNGQNGNGAWQLCIKDIAAGQTGNLISWSIRFSNVNDATPPPCSVNPVPGNTCADATAVCSFYGFCGTTSQTYTPDSWTELDNAYCGTIENNAFVRFIATAYEMNFNVWVTSSTTHEGIQMFFYDGGCGSGAVNVYGCYSPIRPGASPTVVSATGLTAGNIYYLMIDGYAGDVCNYIIEPLPANGGLTISASPDTVCPGKSVELTATGGNGIYHWSGPQLSTSTGSTVIATPLTDTIYSVTSVENGGFCPVTRQIRIAVKALPLQPTAPDTLRYCQGTNAPALAATGTDLLWYNSAAGGTGNMNAIIPSTQNPGINIYYVSQSLAGCESPRSEIYVLTKAGPALGPDQQDTICFGTSADLTRKFGIRSLITSWMFNGEDIDAPQAANTPGIYRLDAVNNAGCYDTAYIHLIVQQVLHAYAGNDTFAVKGMPHQLYCNNAETYSWSPAFPLNHSNVQNPVATLQNDQQFIVQIADIAGCKASDTVLVKIYEGPAYYVPNAFSPNDDGLNDIFRMIPVGIVHTEACRIINRYGKTVFETTDPFKGWNGTYLNTKQPSGTYVWFVRGMGKDGKRINMKGTVVLIR